MAKLSASPFDCVVPLNDLLTAVVAAPDRLWRTTFIIIIIIIIFIIIIITINIIIVIIIINILIVIIIIIIKV